MNKRLLAALAATMLACSGCRPMAKEYMTPPVEGVVVDLATNRPVEGASVRFGEHKVGTETDAAGRFRMDATYRRRLFKLLLPGFALQRMPVYAEHPGYGRGVAWATKALMALDEPQTSRLLVILFRDDAQPPDDCHLREDLRMAKALMENLSDQERRDGIRQWVGQYPGHAGQLLAMLNHHLYRISRECGLSAEETDELRESLQFPAKR